MRIGLIPESLREWLLLRSGRVPTPLADTHLAFLQARALLAATELGLFEALLKSLRTGNQVAECCGLAPHATHKLLNALAAAGYVKARNGIFELEPVATKWCVEQSEVSLHSKLLFLRDEWDLVTDLDEFVRSGNGENLHDTLSSATWARYQAAMSDMARICAPEIAHKTPKPSNPRHLLDIGGGHGVVAGAFCARYEGLEATVFDLPQALSDVRSPHPRVEFRVGDVLVDDLGEDRFDIILIANLAHHLTAEENRRLIVSAARALRRDGVLAVIEWTGSRRSEPDLLALLDLYFALTSRAGTWAMEEIRDWQRAAGLRPLRSRPVRRSPGVTIVPARKGRA